MTPNGQSNRQIENQSIYKDINTTLEKDTQVHVQFLYKEIEPRMLNQIKNGGYP